MSPGIVAESDLSGNLKSEYVFFDGERVARKDFSGSTTSVAYYFSDHLKTASVITNSAGVITEDEDYYPWGGELQFVNSDSNHYKFTGKERDAESGLDYFGARYYGNWTGRFLNPDWDGHPTEVPYANFGNPQSLNLYSYVKNNPTTLGDPDGHQCSGPSCVLLAREVVTRANDDPGGFAKSFVKGTFKQMQANGRANWGLKPSAANAPANDVERVGGAVFNASMTGVAYGAAVIGAGKGGGEVAPYEVGTYGELSGRAVGDGLTIDHIPSNASNLMRATAAKGEALTPADAAAVKNEGTAVAVPDAAHRSTSPTYGGRNTPAQIGADAANPQAAAARDTRAMVNAASPANRNAAQAAAKQIRQRAAGQKP